MITAHSGCDGYAANSEEYIHHALTLAIDALEIDVRRESGGSLILTHNPPEAGQEYMPLSEAFSVLKSSSIRINCDLKEKGLELDVIDLAGVCGIDRERIIITGSLTDWRDSSLTELIWLNPEEIYPDFYSVKHDAGEVMSLARAHGYRVLNIDYRILSEEMMSLAAVHELGLSLWTIDDTEELPGDIYTWPLINITTNLPSEIAQALSTS